MTRTDIKDVIRQAGLDDVFTWQQSVAVGLGRNELYNKSVQRVLTGVYTTCADPDDEFVRAKATLLRAGPGTAICGATALRLFNVDLPACLANDARVHIRMPPGLTGPQVRGIRVWRSDRLATDWVFRDLPMVNPAECWMQLASVLGLDDLIILADALTRRQHPLTKLTKLWSIVPTHHRGSCLARRALTLARERTDSSPETVLRLMQVRAGLPCPEVNLEVMSPRGQQYFLDTAHREAMVAAEYAGAVHAGDRQKMERDERRRRELEDMGWRVITVTSADMFGSPASVVRSIADALRRSRR